VVIAPAIWASGEPARLSAMTTTIDLTALNRKLCINGLTYVEWDDCTEQYLLTVNYTDFPFIDLIKSNLKEFGLIVDEFINGHSFIRPKAVGNAMDLRLKEWHFSLITK
jgi:hypothetical protein